MGNNIATPYGTINAPEAPASGSATALKTLAIQGTAAQGATPTLNPFAIAFESRLTQRAATGDAQISRPVVDRNGRVIVRMNAIRELEDNNSINLSTTTETTLIAAGGAGVFNDITDLIVANKSVTDTVVQIRSVTAGAVILEIAVKAGTTEMVAPTGMLKQATANTAWTAQLTVAVTDVRITAISNRSA